MPGTMLGPPIKVLHPVYSLESPGKLLHIMMGPHPQEFWFLLLWAYCPGCPIFFPQPFLFQNVQPGLRIPALGTETFSSAGNREPLGGWTGKWQLYLLDSPGGGKRAPEFGVKQLRFEAPTLRAGLASQFAGPGAKWNAGSFVQKLLRISRWWQQSIKPRGWGGEILSAKSWAHATRPWSHPSFTVYDLGKVIDRP